MSNLASGIAAVNAELATLVHSLTPATEATWKTAVAVYQINAISNLVYGFMGLVVFALIAWVFRGVYVVQRPILDEQKREKYERYNGRDTWTIWQKAVYEDTEVWVVTISVVLGFIALLGLAISTQLLSIWSWLALIHPHLYAAHEVMNSVANNS
jgi:hypothetical protein